ncbi:hypothetical protein N9355_00545 [Crocinitomicaceae bacterium]|nr:hypothetical protein [Crocinitomicaceae bacterium]
MPTSLNFQSPFDNESQVLVTKDSNWTNIKVYANGGLQYQSSNGDELRSGVSLDLGGKGTLELILKSELEVSVKGTKYDALQIEAEEKVSNVSAIFWVLAGFSVIGLLFLFMLSEMMDTTSFQILMALQIFVVLVYSATAVLIRRNVYWFYFVGAGTFTFFTALQLIDIQATFLNAITIFIFAIRVVLLVLVLRILPTILKRMRNSGSSAHHNTILDQ